MTRFSAAGAAPVYLDAVNNSANTVELGPVSPQPNGTLLLTVEPYDAAGTLMEYGYLGVIEVREATPAPSAYETWTSGRGLADTEAAHDADPDGDGRANLLEFALGTEPALADGSTAATVALVGQAAGGGGYLELVANKPAAAAGQVSYAAEVSSDLAAWTGDVTVLADSATIFRARDNVALSGVSRRFIRLVVTGAP